MNKWEKLLDEIITLKECAGMCTSHEISENYRKKHTEKKKELLEHLKTKPCEHPYFDVNKYYDKNGEVVKCTKCDMVIERGN